MNPSRLLKTSNPQDTRTPAEIAADEVRSAPTRVAQSLFRLMEDSLDYLWSDRGGVTPAEKLEALGTDAVDLFWLSHQTVGFLLGITEGLEDDPRRARIAELLSRIPPHTKHPDGRITIDPVPDPEDSPEELPEGEDLVDEEDDA